jgi:hypothetical protein
MSSIAQVADALKRVLTTHAKERERETGFVERSTAQLDGPTFSQTIVFGWMDTPEASYPQLRHVAASLGVPVSSQAVEQRFGAESAALLRELLQEAVGEVLWSEASAPELLSRFNGVYVQDGTIISLPPELGDEWRGCGGSTPEAGQSSMRVQVRVDLAQGGMQGPWLQEGRAAERSGEAHEAPLPEGCLYNVDAGYFTLAEMRTHGKAGCFWLTTAKAGTLLIDERGQCWDLVSFLGAQRGDEVDVQVRLGQARTAAGAADRQAGQSRASRATTSQGQSVAGGQSQRSAATQWTQASSGRQQAAAATQAEEDGQGAPAALRLDDPADQRATGAALNRRGVGASALPLANRTVLEAVEAGGQSRYVAQCQTVPYSDGNLRQAAGLSHHALAHAHRVLAGAQSQYGESAASGAVDGSGAGLRRGRSRAAGDDGAMHLAHHGLWLYRQRPTEEACGLSTGRSSQAHPGLRLMPIGRP